MFSPIDGATAEAAATVEAAVTIVGAPFWRPIGVLFTLLFEANVAVVEDLFFLLLLFGDATENRQVFLVRNLF